MDSFSSSYYFYFSPCSPLFPSFVGGFLSIIYENGMIGFNAIQDNTCVMHRACGGSFAGKYVRDMRRATVHDSSSTAWGLNEKTDARAGMFGAVETIQYHANSM